MFTRNIGAAVPSSTSTGNTPFRLISLSERQTQPMFSDNARVYYTPGTLSGTTVGTVTNRRRIGMRT